MHNKREFILNTIENYYEVSNLQVNDHANEAISDFVHNVNIKLLQCCIRNDCQLYCSGKIQDVKIKCIIFYKSSALDSTNSDGVTSINLITLSNTATESLYQVLRHIYSPLLVAGNDLYSSKLQKNLSDLELNLRAINYGKEENKNVIFSIQDEFDYWQMLAQKTDASRKEREAATVFSDLFQDVCEEIRLMQTSPLSDVRELVENIGGLLDDVWRSTVMPYPQDRMVHIIDIIGHIICTTLQKACSTVEIWVMEEELKNNEVMAVLCEGLKAAQTWTSACAALTATYWPNYALHPWRGGAYVPHFCDRFQARLKEINDIRSTYNQLNKLLTKTERMELKTHQLFDVFKNVNVWICNGPNQAWETATAAFASNLRPAEAKVADKLKPRLHNTSTKQMLYEFMRYKTLIERPLVKRALNSELELFVSSLGAMLSAIQAQVDADDADVRMHRPNEMSPLVQRVQWAKQMEAKIKDIHTCAEKYLNEFEGSAELQKLATQLLKDLKTMYSQLHEEWSRELLDEVKSGSLCVSEDKPVVEFSGSSRLMVVSFSPRLVWREQEARALAALQLPPPAPAAAALDRLAAQLRHARTLQQVASFHNTVGERLVPSTRPLLLPAALQLSALVRDHTPVYWHHADRLADYTQRLQQMVLKLDAQNTYLTSQHVAIRNIVVKLFDTELLVKQAEWKKNIKDIRDIIEKVESNGYKNTELWRAHWDWQLYKALECQYVRTLLSLHKHFPQVKVDLVLRGRAVRVQPPLEELRAQHYHQLRRLVAAPAHFAGLQPVALHEQHIFAAIVHKHGWLGNKAVQQIECALAQLERSCSEWTRRCALACVPDLDALCTDALRDPHHWETNFKACKAYGQAVAKMTFDDEKIEWLCVSTSTLRRELEAAARALWGALVAALRARRRDARASLDAFVAGARRLLAAGGAERAPPRSAAELADISRDQRALQEKVPEMEKTVETLKHMSHLLRTWGGDASAAADDALREWRRVRELMLSHQQMFEHQAELVKSSLNGEWENLTASVEAWWSRWAAARAHLAPARGAPYADVLRRCRSVLAAHAQYRTHLAARDALVKECEKFNMNCELSETWLEAEKMITEDYKLWSVMEEYNEDFEAIADQEWIVFQKKFHLLDEFISKWKGRLEPYTSVTLFLQQELDKYCDVTALLKYVRGGDFTERHWREVLALLGLEHKRPEALLLRDLLDAADSIKTHIKTLQKINVSATREAGVRSALGELELWYAGARLALVQRADLRGQCTPIVKDFKDILAKVEEQQFVVSSVSGAAGAAGAAGEDACAVWAARLRAARALLRAAHHAQRRWLYLEPILCTDEGELGVKFRKVDLVFRQAARLLAADPRLCVLLQSARLQAMLDSITDQLLACQSALNQYIDEKRASFPRFYFLSDDDLLELLGQARAGAGAEGRAAVMHTHLRKLFPGAASVRLGPGELCVTALCTQRGEALQLDHPVDIDCPVEVWLKNLETEMRSSLKNMTLKCIASDSLKEQDPFSLPTQVLCLVQNIRFTEQAERAIAAKELHELKASVDKEYSYYAAAEVDNDNERTKRQALILQCTYYLSVIQTLIDNNVLSVGEWLWQKQLRFYLMSTKEVVARMGLAQMSYSYEYLGVNTGQFVRTQLADECFLILTQSLHLGFVGNPFGPAGTGKTESVKALGSLIGRLVLVFNCDEAMDSECMGRLLSGVAQCGAWGCFDEFNRLSADTLAAAAHQLAALLAAQRGERGDAATALLNGKQVCVSPWCGVAATLNPVSRGYGGRRALPAALGRALRPVHVAARAEHARSLAAALLAAAAVPHASALADDLHDVFTMTDTLLSGQRHYDWGLRALKAAVGSCGAQLAGAGAASAGGSLPAARAALRRVLCLNNLSKLTSHDAARFQDILTMVFGDNVEEECAKDSITSSLEAGVSALGLVYNQQQIQKSIELYEQLQQRMGVVIVGPPGSGKTTIRRLLKTALTLQGKNIVEYTIRPKAMCRSWLLGHIDHDTRQWTDGAISATAQEVATQPDDVWSWVVLDGDVDPEWIEALNSVLDDNRLLTLPSGWRVQFGPNVNFVFETHSLEYASPATVSRMGIILLSEDSSCADEVLTTWMRRADFETEMVKMALPLLEQVIKKCMQWFSAHRSDTVLKVYNISMVKQILNQFEYLALEAEAGAGAGAGAGHAAPEELVGSALRRSVAGLLKQGALDAFRDEMSELVGPLVETLEEMGMGVSGDVSGDVGGGWWASDALLMSRRLARAEPALRGALHAAARDAHLLLVGPDACAKNIIAEHVLKESNSLVITIDCTPMLEPADIIAELKRNNVVHSGGGGGGGGGGGAGAASVTLLVRALHRARADRWGCSPVHELLLQLVQEGGFWAREGEEGAPQRYGCARVRLVATAAPPAPLAHAPRLAAALQLLVLGEPDDDEMLELANYNLRQSADKSISNKEVSNLAATVLAMFKELTETFYSKPHYVWNASHLKRWCQDIKWYSPSNMEDLIMAISSEANVIFRDRLVSIEEKAQCEAICRGYLKAGDEAQWLVGKLRGDGVRLQPAGRAAWADHTQRLINQCVSESECNVFGDTGIDVYAELAVLGVAMARALNGGLAVCVCAAGVGRRAAARLAAAALPARLHALEQRADLAAALKTVVTSAGEGTRTLLLVSEAAASGAVLAALEALRRPHALRGLGARQPPAAHEHDVKQNLGIVICLDNEQEDLYELMEQYPMLHKEGHVVWLEGWSGETLRELPRRLILRWAKEDLCEDSAEVAEGAPVEGMARVHAALPAGWRRAPALYLRLVHAYYRLAAAKKRALAQRRDMLAAGVSALRRARSTVGALQTEAAAQEAALADKQAQANRALEQIGATVRANTERREEMHLLKQSIEAENEKLQIRKKEIEEELASVEPVIAAARAAVGDIKPESLSEVRSLRAPPDVVRDVLEGVLRLMGIADTSWHSMKNFLSKRGVKEDIRCMDASQISPEAVVSVQRLLERRGASFEAGAARRASAACAPLAAWVRANLAYAQALQRVQPLQAQQRALHDKVSSSESEVSALSAGLAGVEQAVAALQRQLGEHTRDAAALELRLAAAADTLRAARDLLLQLQQENTAWEADLENISKEMSEVNQRSLLAAAYVVYLPDLTEPEANEYIKKWSALIGFEDASFSVVSFLSTAEAQLKWEADGLPSDRTALKNAVTIHQFLGTPKCGCTPLVVDPEGEAVRWLRGSLGGALGDFVPASSDALRTAVHVAGRLGRVLVITEVESLDEWWWPAAVGLAGGGGGGGAARVVLVTRLGALGGGLAAHRAARLAVLHFAPTHDGLVDQLIHFALQQQNPEINEQATEIKLKMSALQTEQHELQERLLVELSSKEDILHDAGVMSSLRGTRSASGTVREALAAAGAAAAALHAHRARYARSAQAAARLALGARSARAAPPLPLHALLHVYAEAVQDQPEAMDEEEVTRRVTRRIAERTLLGLRHRDKHAVLLHLLRAVYPDHFPEHLWQIFIGNLNYNYDQNIINEIKNTYKWIPDDFVKKLAPLKATSEQFFNKLSLGSERAWAEFLSGGGGGGAGEALGLSAFEAVVATGAMRPHAQYQAIVRLVDALLGSGVVSAAEGVGGALRWSGARRGAGARGVRPVLLLAAHAADVLAAHAHAHGVALTQVGVEEGAPAWEAALAGAGAGGGGGAWLALVVAASPFTHELHAFLAALECRPAEDFHPEFRLWIVAEDREVPPLLASTCLQVVLEAAEGVKPNVLGTLRAWGECGGGGGGGGAARRVRQLACLALFHALVQQRRAYVPQGWSRWYEWGWGEVSACARVCGAGSAGGAGGAGDARALWLALYGARVEAPPDRALLAALHRACLGDHALAHQWRPAGARLPAPLPYTDRLQDYTSAFAALPELDTPELLHLPANCRLAWEKNAADNIIVKLKEISSTTGQHQKDNSANATRLKILLALWKKLMSGNPLIKPDYHIEKEASGWWGCVCASEAREAARVGRALHAALAARARRPPAAHAHDPLLEVPEQWLAWWAGPAEPAAYLRAFAHRAHAALQRLAPADALPHDHMPTEVDLRSFLDVPRLLCALRARTAARRRLAPGALALAAAWDGRQADEEASSDAASPGLVVRGLRLSGAEWAGGALRPAAASAAPHTPAPPLLLRYLPQPEQWSEAAGALEVPVYASEARAALVCSVRAPLAAGFARDAALLHAAALFVAPLD